MPYLDAACIYNQALKPAPPCPTHGPDEVREYETAVTRFCDANATPERSSEGITRAMLAVAVIESADTPGNKARMLDWLSDQIEAGA